MNELFSPPSFNISNINIPEEFGLSRELFFFDNSDNYVRMDQNMIAANDPFITTQGDHVVETNYMTNGIVFQIRGDLNNDEEKVKAKARRIRDLYGKIPSVLRKGTDKKVNSVDDLDSTKDILPPEYKRHKDRVAHGRIKS
ncbi:hypothetical protein RhiirA4_480690 [Rhizophagus irregularis]|uniref:Uncharacterized protein n=1 Tax=Rhizophagus irregularis TaxID=588596 RepID=A0A2I1HIF4_9GLOM|nr:hypothetical protein RhiirA4_480690 [Rhizophagus irregularis]